MFIEDEFTKERTEYNYIFHFYECQSVFIIILILTLVFTFLLRFYYDPQFVNIRLWIIYKNKMIK